MSEETKIETPVEDERKDPNEWLEEITCDLGLRQHLDAEIAKANEEFKKSANPSWYPSDLGKKDLFSRFIKRKGYDAIPFDRRTLRKFEIGKLWEARLHQVIDARIARGEGNIKEIDLHPDATFEAFKKRVENNNLELRGYYDRLLLQKVNDNDWWVIVYEIKSVASMSFHKQKKEGEQPKGNRMQMMFYLERLQAKENWEKLCATAQSKYGITPVKIVGVLSQVSKDDGSMWERTYEFDPILYAEIEKEIATLNEYWKADKLPPKPDLIVFDEGKAKVNWEVSYSNYIHHILGSNYAAILKQAERLVYGHSTALKKYPSKVGIVAQNIAEFNASLK